MTEEEAKKLIDEGVKYFNKADYEKAIEYLEKIPPDNGQYYAVQNAIGVIYYKEEKYEEAINCWEKIPSTKKEYHNAQKFTGIAYIQENNEAEASNAFVKSQKEVFELFSLFNLKKIKTNAAKIKIGKGTLSNVLDNKTDDFFNTTIKEDNRNRDKYKEIFLRSLYTISLLHVSSDQEKQVAHYTEKSVAEKMLFAKSKLRLSSTIGANDPKEGVTLLDFLGIENKAHLQTPYQAFITCFTFNPESLNQFRLYGKEDNKEATGVSIIIKNEFFSSSAGISGFTTGALDDTTTSPKAKNKEEKHSLYRCVYIDPKTKKVISIGHKEEYNFYREIKGDKNITIQERRELISGIKSYKDEINTTLEAVKKQIKVLNAYIKKHKAHLDESIISELLLPLRHLTKHVAFKEEQECRIFDIENLKNPEKKILLIDSSSFSSKMYIEYEADLSQYTHKVIFAPMTGGIDQFHAFAKRKGHDFTCERCDHPFSN